ncbi:hypothetical protein SK128_020684, partial [Halocaridina rubra]
GVVNAAYSFTIVHLSAGLELKKKKICSRPWLEGITDSFTENLNEMIRFISTR